MKAALKFEIQAIAAAVPAQTFHCSSLYESFGQKNIDAIMKTTGISTVRVAGEQTTASDLCFNAAQELLHQIPLDNKAIDGLIFVSQTPDYILPQTSHVLQSRLGLGEDTFCLDIRLGCSGYVHGILQAALLLNATSCKHVLVLAGDTNSRMINPGDKSVKMIFGDAGSATLVSRSEHVGYFEIMSDGSGADRLIVPAGGFRKPSTPETGITKETEDGNMRSENDMFMDGLEIFNFMINRVPQLVESMLTTLAWEKDQLDVLALHQPNAFVLNYLRKRLKLEPAKVPTVLEGFGNTGPATLPLIFSEKGGALRENTALNRVLMAGFGVGLSWAGFSCDLSRTTFIKPKELD